MRHQTHPSLSANMVQAICVLLFAAAASALDCNYPVGTQSLVASYGDASCGSYGNNVYPLSGSDSYSPIESNLPYSSSCGSSAALSPIQYASAPSVPATKVISNNCKCVKTIRRSQEVKQIIEVPTIRQYIQTFNKPVVQKVTYKTKPRNNVPLYQSQVAFSSSPLYQTQSPYGSDCGSYPAQLETYGSYPNSYPAQYETSGSCPGSYPAQLETYGSCPTGVNTYSSCQ